MSEHRTGTEDHTHGQAALNSLPVLVTTHATDGNGTYTGVYTGLQVKSTESPKELLDRPLADVLNPEATGRLLAAFDKTIDTGVRQYIEFPVYFGDETFWRGAYVVPLSTDDEPTEVVVAGFDLSRYKERIDALYDVFDALETHTSRRDLERAVCERLVDHRRYEMAWLGTYDSDGELTVRATTNADGYLDELREVGDGLEILSDPGVRVLRSRELVSVTTIDPTDGEWAAIAADHGLQAAIALPLEHDGIDHGVLAVYLADAEYLAPWREEVLVDYADAVGYALSAAMWQWELGGDTATVLDVEIGNEMPVSELCARAGCDALDVASVVPRPEETVYYLEPVNDGVDLGVAIERCDGISPYGDAADHRAVIIEMETPERRLVQLGAQIRTFRVTPDGATITLAVPSSAVARRIRRHVREAYPNARLIVQWGEGGSDEHTALEGNVEAVLTDRQYEILEAAYRYGYFERDPQVNLSDLADVLDVSRWTVSEHLRVAQREMLSELLE